MGLIEVASGNSVWRGMDYYNDKKVDSWNCRLQQTLGKKLSTGKRKMR